MKARLVKYGLEKDHGNSKINGASKDNKDNKDFNNEIFYGLGLASREENIETIPFENSIETVIDKHTTIIKADEVVYGLDMDGSKIVLPPETIAYERDPYETDMDQSGEGGTRRNKIG